ncbi:MAG: hypothetical protein FRX48_00809 [Lasallia pustulata]|uniref:UBX domain-containing protein n=1 Tax=Lasallia pustulata TaxID=136370 RepID=A0A5M8Q3V7_9LECA|nr:MAG: hypothetical protein FRX48_00809 [Lasallia pustulata]
MEEDGAVAQFTAITGTTLEIANQYLRLTDGNMQQAIELFFASDGVDLEVPTSTTRVPQAPPVPSTSTRPSGHRSPYEDEDGVVHVDSDPEISDADEPEITAYSSRPVPAAARSTSAVPTPASATPSAGRASGEIDEDEAMARRLQEELYAGGDLSSRGDAEDVRAPLGRTTETLVGPEPYDILSDSNEMRAAVLEQMRSRQRPRPHGRPGIFNQQSVSPSIWSDVEADRNTRRDRLAQATAGASEASSKSNLLAEMYRPPFELMSRLPWDEARKEGKDTEKWILVNIQDPAVFDCQVLNRDIWKNPGIRDTVKENFLFMQFAKDDPRGKQYIQYYFQARDNQDAYPHIAIVDPRTGEQVKVWSGPPAPKAMDFLMQLHEFLDRYSLKVTAKNPVAKRKPEARKEKQVEKMTEEEMLEMALQNSLAGNGVPAEDDPDDLTRSVGDLGKGKGKAGEEDADMTDAEASHTNGGSQTSITVPSPFSTISSSSPHPEPPPDPASTTRIQFRHPNGRVVRRFSLSDAVRRIYEWLKASPLEGREGQEFELIFMQKNLINLLEDSIEQAGLKNGTVMVEYLEG